MVITGAIWLLSGWALAAPTEAELVEQYLGGASQATITRDIGPSLPEPILRGYSEQLGGSVVLNSLGAGLDFDLSGQHLALRGAARQDTIAASAALDAERMGSVCSMRAELLHYMDASARLAVMAASQDRLNSLVASIDTLAAEGGVSATDVARIGMAAQSREALPAELLGARAIAAERVEMGLHEPLTAVTFAQLPPLPPLESLVGRSLSQSADLASQRAAAEAAARRLTAARLGLVPDLTVYAAMRWDELPGAIDTGFEAGIMLEIPLGDRQKLERRAASSERARLEYDLAMSRSVLEAEIGGLYATAAALESDPPPALVRPEAHWDAAISRYLSEKADLSEVLNVAEDLEALAMENIHYDISRRRARLELSCAAGVFLEPEIQDVIDATR